MLFLLIDVTLVKYNLINFKRSKNFEKITRGNNKMIKFIKKKQLITVTNLKLKYRNVLCMISALCLQFPQAHNYHPLF